MNLFAYFCIDDTLFKKYFFVKRRRAYKKVAAGAPMEGVFVYAFAENCVHDVYKIGDIIVEWNGEKVRDKESLSGYYKKSSSGRMKLLRLQGTSLKELEIAIPGNEDIVAFVDL